ncbi:peptide deformylase [Streptomyces sp. SYP-A7193]|uniref:peptide deformylase n=1 Tax=Streptomyces sp. SYP-A7193 TaxID=2662065 RepID=UPI00129228DF|nr:peptide deformylase [Streptomyces sp. SYP-A7193]QFX80066.1 helix-turn-helix domain-containing protein [Streptomyces sp. SYP-A7193]
MEPQGQATLEQAHQHFAAEVARWREVRGMSKKVLAERMGFHPSYVSHMESGRTKPSEDFARRADETLNTGKAIWYLWCEYETARLRSTKLAAVPAARKAEQPYATGSSVLVEHDAARLDYDGSRYRLTMRRLLRNTGTEPITRYLIRISVDRYPGEPERSNHHYRAHPLTWEELNLTAVCRGEAMRWQAKHDRDAFKEVWLLFDNDQGRFPLYPGESVWIEYAYTVSEEKWGHWFQRAVRLPTGHLEVELAFPTELDPAVWGTVTSMTSEASPLNSAPTRREENGTTVFTWSTGHPILHARYRLEWRFRAARTRRDSTGVHVNEVRPSEQMRNLGVVQEGAPILAEPARPFSLPAEREVAEQAVESLFTSMERIAGVHTFAKGMGIAAPQIGIGRAAAVVQPAEPGAGAIVLLNPRVIAASRETDDQYEGCLSFFDVRGLVPRPLRITVETMTLDGTTVITDYERGLARLIQHEIDHLDGHLYTARMRPGVQPISVTEYRQTGRAWSYEH